MAARRLKLCIASKHIIPVMLKEFNMSLDSVHFSDEVLRYMIGYVEAEQGVRNLKRGIHDVISNINLSNLLENKTDSINITNDHVVKYVYKKKLDMHFSHSMIYT